MGFNIRQRPSESPFVETIMHGWTEGEGKTIRPTESHWHLVVVTCMGKTQVIATGPLSTTGIVPWTAGVEILWIKFRLGAFMPDFPIKLMLDKETPFPEANGNKFWLKGSAWEIPNSENADTFIEGLVRAELLVRDPLIEIALQGQPLPLSPRTLRHRFLRATGLTQTAIFQMERAQRAGMLLSQGVSILYTVFEAGFFDQPHLTRGLKRWLGHTPAQLLRQTESVASGGTG